jgi:hypothetical protein
MLIPANAPAEEIRRRRDINEDIAKQIEQLQTSVAKNQEIIDALEPIAEWTELPDPVVEETPAPIEPPVAEIPAPETLPSTV